jgi:hypothetical protein
MDIKIVFGVGNFINKVPVNFKDYIFSCFLGKATNIGRK